VQRVFCASPSRLSRAALLLVVADDLDVGDLHARRQGGALGQEQDFRRATLEQRAILAVQAIVAAEILGGFEVAAARKHVGLARRPMDHSHGIAPQPDKSATQPQYPARLAAVGRPHPVIGSSSRMWRRTRMGALDYRRPAAGGQAVTEKRSA